MSIKPFIDDALRERIIAAPESLLDDAAIMRALVAANERAMGSNVVDLRGIAMDRLESRLDRLEDTHRSVIAAAYENLAGTNQINRAVLRLLDANKFETFLKDLGGDIADILRVDSLKLVLESEHREADPALERLGDVVRAAPKGYIDDYVSLGRGNAERQVTLRQVHPDHSGLYGRKAEYIRSEACLKLDFGPNRRPGMLLLGSEDPHHFSPQQGTDLLTFFAGVFERVMRRWLG